MRIIRSFFDAVRSDDLLLFYFELADMIGAGFDLLNCLDTIGAGTKSKKLKSVIGELISHIMKGSDFSDAIAHYPDVFPELFINMVRSGESSGRLSDVLNSYAEMYEGQLDVRQKITDAFFYPSILFCLGSVVIFFLVTVIVPMFVKIFAEAGVALPWPTKVLFFVGCGVLRYWYVLVAVVVAAVFGLSQYRATSAGQMRIDAILLTLPIVGTFNRNTLLVLFARTLGLLLRSGVPLLRSIDLTRAVVRNSVFTGALLRANADLKKGKTLAVSLKASGVFPGSMVQMISVGEETGDLAAMLEKTGVLYGKAAASSVKKMTVAIEPLFLVVMGLAVALIMASIFMPLSKMIDIVQVM